MKKLTLLLTSTLTILAGTIISPAIPVIEKILDPGGGISMTVSLILTITSLFIAIGAPVSGWIADTYGRKKLLLASLVLYAIAGSAGLFLETAPEILISRMILGFAVSGIMNSSTTLIADYLSGEEREQFLGYQVAFMAIGGFVFLSAGGLLASIWWRAPFAIYFVSLFLIPLVYIVIDEPVQVSQEDRSALDFHFSKPLFAIIVLSGMMGMMLYFLIPTRITFYLDIYHNLSPHLMGLFMGTGAISISFVASRYRHIHTRVSKPFIYAISFLIVGLGLELIAHVEGIVYVFAAVVITGLGFGLNLPNSTVWVTEIAPTPFRGRMIGILTSAVFLGQFLSTLFGEPLFRSNGLKGITGVYGVGGLVALTIGVSYGIMGIYQRRH